MRVITTAVGARLLNLWTTRQTKQHGAISARRTARGLCAMMCSFRISRNRVHRKPGRRTLGNAFAEPVLLIKTAWGGKSLAKDFRPPSSGGAVGPYYKQMIAEYRAAVAAIPTQFPALAGYSPRLDGVIWFQGWNDGCDEKAAAEYEGNLVHLITDMRAEFGNPKLSFVVGETGNMDNAVLRHAQRDGCLHKEVATGTSFVPTRQFLRDAKECPNPGHGHHWFGSGESYLLIGDALGKAAVKLAPDRRPAHAPAPVTSSARPAQP